MDFLQEPCDQQRSHVKPFLETTMYWKIGHMSQMGYTFFYIGSLDGTANMMNYGNEIENNLSKFFTTFNFLRKDFIFLNMFQLKAKI